jgi:hypothetical protein
MKVLLSLLIVFSIQVIGQSKSSVPEIGIIGGGSYYLGDLNPTRHFANTKLAAGLFYRNTVNRGDQVCWRIHFNYANVAGDDATSRNEELVQRNLNFKSRIFEFGGAMEFHFLKYEIGSDRRPGTPYLFIGLNFFKMNPLGQYEGNSIELQTLGTEGQGTDLSNKKQYKLNQLSIPIGFGMKVNLTTRLALGLEYGVRKTFTDYLDDVGGKYVNENDLRVQSGSVSASLSDPSTGSSYGREGQNRGLSSNKDWYTMFGISLSLRMIKYSTCSR